MLSPRRTQRSRPANTLLLWAYESPDGVTLQYFGEVNLADRKKDGMYKRVGGHTFATLALPTDENHPARGVRGTPKLSAALAPDNGHMASFEVTSVNNNAAGPKFGLGIRYFYTGGISRMLPVTANARELGIHAHATLSRPPLVTYVDKHPTTGFDVVMGWCPNTNGKFVISDPNTSSSDPVTSTADGYLVSYATNINRNEEIAFYRLP